jgi:hypothetical protein
MIEGILIIVSVWAVVMAIVALVILIREGDSYD